MRASFGAQLPVSIEIGSHGEVRIVVDPDNIRHLVPDYVFVDPEDGTPPVTLTENSPEPPSEEVAALVEDEALKLAAAFADDSKPIEFCYLIA